MFIFVVRFVIGYYKFIKMLIMEYNFINYKCICYFKVEMFNCSWEYYQFMDCWCIIWDFFDKLVFYEIIENIVMMAFMVFFGVYK